MQIVILAGGRGTRLWPLSRTGKSKQFNAITGEKTMLEITLNRFLGSYPKEKIFISTTPECLENVTKTLPDFPQEQIIVEPEMRDTAAAMGFVAGFLSLKNPDEPLAFIASDHHIHNQAKFLEILKVAEQEIKATGKLLDVGIVPEGPSTALGYTRIGQRIKVENGVEIFEFLGHKEKPEYKVAQEYVKSGEYLWHGNFYMWTPSAFLGAFETYAPEIYQKLKEIVELLKAKAPAEKIKSIYQEIPKVMIDLALTEKMNSHDILIIKGEFGWSDIGGWDVLHKKLAVKQDEQGNLVKGEWVGIDTSQSLIYSYPGKLVATIGVDDLVVVDTPDALLICPKGRSQEVKKMVEEIKKLRDGEKYL